MKPLKKILHVDDDEDIAEIARMALMTIGDFEVAYCKSGRDAIARAPEFAPDLFLLDSRMPEMDGEETWQALKRIPELQSVPVIFMTARAQPKEVDQLMKIGAIGVVTKPFDPLELAGSIREIWAGHQSSDKRHNSSGMTGAPATF